MNVKLFELRDEATRIAVMVTELSPDIFNGKEKWIYEIGGFGRVLVITDLHTMRSYRSINDIQDRTMNHAYYYICKNWSDLTSGSTLDIGYMLGFYPNEKETDYKGQYEEEVV